MKIISPNHLEDLPKEVSVMRLRLHEQFHSQPNSPGPPFAQGGNSRGMAEKVV